MAIVDDVAIGIQGASHDAQSFRQMLSALVGQDVETFTNSIGQTGPGHGVVRRSHLAVTENGTPNMSVDVAAGVALITGDQTLAQGPYACTNDATTNVTISTADATNARKDLIVLRVYDDTTDGSGQNEAVLEVVTGTPAGSPSDPTIPDNSLVLARVDVPASDTAITNSQITDLRTFVNTYTSGWTSFTPEWGNLTEGAGTNVGAYRYIGLKTLEVYAGITFAGSTSISGSVTLQLPGSATIRSPFPTTCPFGTVTLREDGVASRVGVAYGSAAGTTVSILYYNVPSGQVILSALSSTAPFTWGTNDYISVHIVVPVV